MRRAIDTGLPRSSSPFSWATVGNDTLFTAQIPLDRDGKLVGADIRGQTAQTLRNLKQTVEAAGGTMDDVTQVVVFLTHLDDFAGMNEAYAPFFTAPYPNRATLVVAALAVPGMRVEMLAYAALEGPRRVAARKTGRVKVPRRRGVAARRQRPAKRASR